MFNDSGASVLVVPPSEVGRGYGSLDLHARHLADLQMRMQHANPKLLEDAIEAARMLEIANLSFQAAELEVRRVAGDYTADVMKMARAEAKKQLEAERLEAEHSRVAVKGKPYHAGGVSVGKAPITLDQNAPVPGDYNISGLQPGRTIVVQDTAGPAQVEAGGGLLPGHVVMSDGAGANVEVEATTVAHDQSADLPPAGAVPVDPANVPASPKGGRGNGRNR